MKKGKFEWNLSAESKGMIVKHTPSSEMLSQVKKCDYMGFIQLCRIGHFNGMGKFSPVDLPASYKGDGTATKYKIQTGDNVVTDYYFIDEEYNTFSPIYQTSSIAMIAGHLRIKDGPKFLVELKNKDHLPIS